MARFLSKFNRKQVCEEYSTWGRITTLSTILAITELTPWIISLAFVGRVSSLQLAALSLVEVWVYSFLEVSWVAVTQTGSVLISQADGAGAENAKLGWFAISMIVMTLASAIVSLASVFSAFALDQLTSDKELVQAGSYYARWITPAIFFSSYQQMIATYLIATDHAEYPTICAFMFCFIDVFITYIFMFGGYGIEPFDNALLANAMSWNVSSLLSLIVIVWFFWRVVSTEDEATSDENEDNVSLERLIDRVEIDSSPLQVILEDGSYYQFEPTTAPTKPKSDRASSMGHAGLEKGIGDDRRILNSVQTPRGKPAASGPAHHRRLSSTSNIDRFVRRGSIDIAEIEDVNLEQDSIVDWVKSWKAWKAFSSMLLPFTVTISTEMMIFFALAFLAAKLGRAQIAAHNTCSAIIEYTFSIIIGMAEATSVRIGYYVGKGDLQGCETVVWISVLNSLLVGVILAIICGYYSQEIAEIFTTDREIVKYIMEVSPLLWASFAIFAVGDQMLAILEGQGRGTVQMLSSFIGLWLVTLPLAFWWFYFDDGGLREIWWALLIGYVVNEVTATYAVYISKWEILFEKARDQITLD